MPARKAGEVHRLWADRLKAGDREGLLALYEPDASLAPEPGQVVTGTAAIRETLGGFLGLKATLSLREAKPPIRSGYLALLHSSWPLTGSAPDRSPMNLCGTTADVVRRQLDGTWLGVINNPWVGG